MAGVTLATGRGVAAVDGRLHATRSIMLINKTAEIFANLIFIFLSCRCYILDYMPKRFKYYGLFVLYIVGGDFYI
jgi:hypothetical protein